MRLQAHSPQPCHVQYLDPALSLTVFVLAGLGREGAEEAELRSQLEAVRREEGALPAQIEALQAQLQAELDRVTQREGGEPVLPATLRMMFTCTRRHVPYWFVDYALSRRIA